MAKFPQLDWSANDMSEEFTLFKQQMELCLLDHNIKDKEPQARKIMLAVGKPGMKKINNSSLSEADKKDPAKIWELFQNQLTTKVNFRVHRLEFTRYKIKPGEDLHSFVERCREKGNHCDFTPEELAERVIELVISSTPYEGFQKFLLDQEKGYTIENLLKEGRMYEGLSANKKHLSHLDNPTLDTSSIYRRKPAGTKCGNCGTSHPPRRCPAYNDNCDYCDSKGHWEKMCRKKAKDKSKDKQPKQGQHRSPSRGRRRRRSQSRHRNRHAHEIKTENDSNEPNDEQSGSLSFYNIMVSNMCFEERHKWEKSNEIFANIDIICPEKNGQHSLRAKLDTGSGGNTLPIRTIDQMYPQRQWEQLLEPTGDTLTAYNGQKLKVLGTIDIPCKYHGNTWYTEEFFVVDVPGPAIIGLPTCKKMNLVTVNVKKNQTSLTHTQIDGVESNMLRQTISSVDQLKALYPDQFDRIGNFKMKATLHLQPDATPSIDPPRKCSVHLKEKIKEELQKMEDLGVIKKVTHHTDWCCSMTTNIKKDGSIRVCIDPKRLNNSLKRCAHKIPTVEEINPQLAKAKVFSKLDAKSGYWSIPLDDASQELTTFRTPFGRYCYRKLPFGLSVSQDIFQQEMDRITGELDGCVSIADDIIVFGSTEEEHDTNLLRLMEVAMKEGLAFNSNKCTIKKSKISFYGSDYTSEGIKPDPQKIADLKNMPPPQNVDDLQRFLGLVTYLSTFVPHCAAKSSPLRELLKDNTPFIWHEDHQHVYDSLKEELSVEACLPYFDPSKPATLEVDASQKGLGACLLQDDRPVAFASKSLSECQSNYSNIERETLALVFGVTRFHTYLFGKEFTVISDHKPLEMIWRKPLTSAPPRLQRLLVRLQGYDMTVTYRPGSTMVLSDTLSRLPNPSDTADVPLDIQVECIHVDLVNFGNEKREALQKETTNDPICRKLGQIIHTGWPDSIKELPQDIRPFWACRDELGIANGVLFKGRQVLIPEKLREDILKQLHTGHLGIEKTRRLARESIYWPNINKDIEQLVKNCSACQEHQPNQRKEPLIPHDVPQTPWTKVASDLFTLKGEDFLLITDYYSKYPVLLKMSNNTKSETVAKATATIFSLFGPPKEIVSDNGPQYIGEPYQAMCREWGITHTTSSPRYARSNGAAERMVRTVKSLVTKCKQTKQDLHIAMLHLRATPVDTGIPSPAEMLFGRPIRTTLPSFHIGDTHQKAEVNENLAQRQKTMKDNHDRNAGPELPPLYEGQKVRVKNEDDNTWQPAIVTGTYDTPRSYEVTSPNGTVLRRNRSHIREMPCQPRRITFNKDVDVKTFANDDAKLENAPSDNLKDDPKHPTASYTRSGRVIRRPLRFRKDLAG